MFHTYNMSTQIKSLKDVDQTPYNNPYASFECADNLEILIGIQNEREWVNFCKFVLEDEKIASDEMYCSNNLRVTNTNDLEKIINDKFKKHTRDQIIEKCEHGGIAYGRISNIDQFSKHPQNQFIEINAPRGQVKMIAPGAQHDGIHQFAKNVPELNSNSDRIREEFKD